MSIATRTGDQGTTGLLHGQRVPKDHPQIEAVGAFDELNVEVGAARLASSDTATHEALLRVQGTLVALMGELACAEADVEKYVESKFAKLTEADLGRLDALVASLEARGLKFDGWATPGGNPRALAFDRARVTARRAERSLAALPHAGRNVRPLIQQWTNRLSDVLWLLAREAEAS
ncbi:MAG TPA: cob(I)yrinic acid a,c-diamide adenosyltransferase [Opitutaceae bacterium]|nr:cob(I)yrinic acid a,c-diamide adenosyltransferase [Opitutaceae bacterium]